MQFSGFIIVFHILSIFLCIQDFKKNKVNFIIYFFCVISLILEIWQKKIPMESLTGIILFLATIAVLTYFYKKTIIAPADVIYAFFCLWIIGNEYYFYFINIGFLSLILYFFNTHVFFHKKNALNMTDRIIPFIPVLYGAFVICEMIFKT